jgi:hypothetical protein
MCCWAHLEMMSTKGLTVLLTFMYPISQIRKMEFTELSDLPKVTLSVTNSRCNIDMSAWLHLPYERGTF